MKKDLEGKIAVVTGSSRGAGRGIACVLGERGATVYVTGRSTRGAATTDNLAGTIEDTADEVTRRGGRGIPVRVDHTRDPEVEALFARVRQEHGRLDLLVNNAWGGYEAPGIRPSPFWRAPLRLWDAMFVAGFRAHLVATWFALPLMLGADNPAPPRRPPTRPRGLIVSTVAWDHDKYLGSFYDLAKHAIVRMIWGLATELHPFGIATVAVAPGFMRTERVMKAYGASEDNWRKFKGLKRTETTEYVGRAVAALAADPRILRSTGRTFCAGELARIYGFTDVDGRRVPPFNTGPSFFALLRRYYWRPGRSSTI